MTPFEYILAFVSLLVGLAVTDLAGSLHRLLRARHRVQWDWLPLAAAGLVVLTILDFWWAFYQRGRAPSWITYGGFLPLIALLVVMFLLASAALPDEVPNGGLDLAAYYAENARYFWSLFALFVGLSVVVTGFGGGVRTAVALQQQAGNVLLVLLLASLARINRRRYHAILIPILVVALGTAWSHLRLTGDASKADPPPTMRAGRQGPQT